MANLISSEHEMMMVNSLIRAASAGSYRYTIMGRKDSAGTLHGAGVRQAGSDADAGPTGASPQARSLTAHPAPSLGTSVPHRSPEWSGAVFARKGAGHLTSRILLPSASACGVPNCTGKGLAEISGSQSGSVAGNTAVP